MDAMNTDAFRSFAFYSGILIIKFLLMAPLTAVQRIRKKAFINPEDIAYDKKLKLVANDEDVERVRRAHLNDMENILPFFIIGWLYCFTNPAAATANLLFKVFTFSRIAHTIVYAVFPLPQPSRAIAWFVGIAVNVFLAYKVVMHFW